ncbi:MAG TPA: response regulator, partial [Blastocatellia bacterium]|nr:response regulator [Blastocatellia bacterium]
ITVSDTGKGISLEFLPHVFDKFSQGETGSTRNYGGLGLGLSIARHLAELHGGTVRAESAGENQGSTFIVSIPLSRAVQQTFEGLQGRETVGSASAEPFRLGIEGLRILAVDDESDTLQMLKIVFRQFGASVMTASSCPEALRVIEESDSSEMPDILIADIAMPGENGFDLIRKIREMGPERGGDIPAIALTAYAAHEDRLRAIAEGFQMHLAKPVSIHELVSCVASLTRAV